MFRIASTITILSAIAAGLLLLPPAKVDAHEGATGVVKERMQLMKSMKKSVYLLNRMFRGKRKYRTSSVRSLAAEIGAHAEKIPAMFPEGSNKKPSEATAQIWVDWQGFEKSAVQLAEFAKALDEAADDKDAAKAAFRQMGTACKGCHQDYRQEQK